MEIASPSSPPLQKSRATVRVRVFSFNPSQNYHLSSIRRFLFFFLFLIFNIFTTTSLSSSPYSLLYTEYCNAIVPESTPTDTKLAAANEFLGLQNAYYKGGDPIFGETPKSGVGDSPRSLALRTTRLYETLADGVIKVEANLILRNAKMFVFLGNSTRRRKLRFFRPPRFPLRSGVVSFGVHGFWSSTSGKLCMVGSGSSYSKDGNLRYFSVVLKLNYRNTSSIITSLVSGTLESLDEVSSSNYFLSVSLLGVSLTNYEYTLVEKENENGGFSGYDGYQNVSLGLEPDQKVCSLLGMLAYGFELEYESDCSTSTVICNPLGGSSNSLPSFMSFYGIQCLHKGRVRALLKLSNSSYIGHSLPFDPNTTLVSEGVWDETKNRLCLIACRIFNFTDSLANAFLGDCSIKLCFRFPATLSIRNRSIVVGQIWSNRTVDDLGYFGRIMFHNSGKRMLRLPGLKYEYTEIDNVRIFCAKRKTVKHEGKTYPNGFSLDMRFEMSVKNSKGQKTSGHLSPLSVGDQFYEHYFARVSKLPAVPKNTRHSSLLNISYQISFTSPPGFRVGGEIYSTNFLDISAEGTYDTETGVLCMIGCRHLGSYNKESTKNNSVDCEIHVSVQFPPLNAYGRSSVKGTIQSTRGKSDPHYFEPLELSSISIYWNQAAETIWRMDLEITMVLISNTLACVFVGLQLFYVKGHPDVLPFISIVMLIVLTLGHMIPLLLNFEALFVANPNRQNVFLGSGGWLEVNEVIVRVVTMIAFLLQFRLLQMAWTSRGVDGSQKGLWVSEKKVLYVSLPLYVGGGLIAWFVHRWKSSYQSPLLRASRTSYHQYSLWGDLRSYAGLVLDSFLLPQIMFNLFLNSIDKALAPSFYIGTTAVRLLPHAYDLYRTHSSSWSLDLSYIYANPKMDLYSTAWDVIIPCCGLLFVVLIYLQQRFGGCSILAKRLRQSSAYETVPVVSSE